MGNIVRGTTPLIRYTFDTISVNDITQAFIVLKQGCNDVVTKTLDDCTIGDGYIDCVLTQEDTLALCDKKPCDICLDWLLADGTRGVGRTAQVGVSNSAVNEVIE